MRFIASALLVFTLTACNIPGDAETNAALEPVTSEEAAPAEEVSAQACVKRCSGGLYAGMTCNGDYNCGKTCSGGAYAGMACSSDRNCGGARCVTHLCASHRCVTYCN